MYKIRGNSLSQSLSITKTRADLEKCNVATNKGVTVVHKAVILCLSKLNRKSIFDKMSPQCICL